MFHISDLAISRICFARTTCLCSTMRGLYVHVPQRASSAAREQRARSKCFLLNRSKEQTAIGGFCANPDAAFTRETERFSGTANSLPCLEKTLERIFTCCSWAHLGSCRK